MQIKDNVFIITGGASGLGAATARMIVDAGGKVVLADVQAEAGQALERAIAIMAKQAKARSIVIKPDIPASLPKIIADEARISQVLINLLDNAIKYTKDGGVVTVSATT